jgi:hypothetical protein
LPKIKIAVAIVAIGAVLGMSGVLQAQFSRARDPGVREGPAGAGEHLPGLTTGQIQFFDVGRADFAEEEEEVDEGLQPAEGVGQAGHPELPALPVA